MERVTVIQKSIPKFGLYTRTSTHGSELDMVNSFIDYFSDRFIKTNKRNNLAIFVEPRISSGFPDVVLATYIPQAYENWSSKRNDLDLTDLKILTYIIKNSGCASSELVKALCFSEKQILHSIECLLDAGLIIRRNGVWKTSKTKSVYGIKKLVSVEAKIGNIKRVAEQSYINTWFASHSYALISSHPSEITLAQLRKHGIGLYCQKNGFKKMIEAQAHDLPSSYVSLQFNEWIGRTMQ